MKNKLIFSYYLILIFIIAFQAIATAVNVGYHIDYGETVAKLENKKAELIEEKSHYERLLSQNMALYKYESAANNGFRPISQTYSITTDHIVASR